MNKKTLIWIIAFLVLISQATAFGIRPAKTIADFEPNAEKEFKFNIINNENSYLDLKIILKGPLADIVELQKDHIVINQEEPYKELPFIISFPDSLMPGQHEVKIIVQQTIPNIELGANYVSAKLFLTHKLIINVPYPKKHISAKFNINQKHKETDLEALVKNLGAEDINNLKSLFSIKTSKWETLVKKETEEVPLQINQEKLLKASIKNSLLPPGEYEAVASILYDDNRFEISKFFTVGEPSVDIVYYDKFILAGVINEFNIELKSNWNKRIENAYAEIIIYQNNKEVVRQRTMSFVILPNHITKIKSYIDARHLSQEDISASIVIYYNNKQQEHILNLVAETTIKRAGRIITTFIPLQITILLAIVLIILIILYSKRRKK